MKYILYILYEENGETKFVDVTDGIGYEMEEILENIRILSKPSMYGCKKVRFTIETAH